MNRSHIDLIHGPEEENQCPVRNHAAQRAFSVLPVLSKRSSAIAFQPPTLPFVQFHAANLSVSFQTPTTWPTTVEPVHRASQFATKDALSARAPSHLSTRSIAATPPVCPHHNRATIPRRPQRPRRPARAQETPAAAGHRALWEEVSI